MMGAPGPELRRIAVCIFDDVIEHASETNATGAARSAAQRLL